MIYIIIYTQKHATLVIIKILLLSHLVIRRKKVESILYLPYFKILISRARRARSLLTNTFNTILYFETYTFTYLITIIYSETYYYYYYLIISHSTHKKHNYILTIEIHTYLRLLFTCKKESKYLKIKDRRRKRKRGKDSKSLLIKFILFFIKSRINTCERLLFWERSQRKTKRVTLYIFFKPTGLLFYLPTDNKPWRRACSSTAVMNTPRVSVTKGKCPGWVK